jgi:hypothetical protein
MDSGSDGFINKVQKSIVPYLALVVPLQSRNQRFDLENNNFSRDPLTSTWKG